MKRVPTLVGDYTEGHKVIVSYQALLIAEVVVGMVCPDETAGDTTRTVIRDLEGNQTYSEKLGHNLALNASFQYLELGQYDGLFLTGERHPSISGQVPG